MNDASREVFRTRARIVRYLRDFLDALDFLEVETPMMQPIPGGAAARPFMTHHNALDLDMYLRIAPELYLKRLVVGGFERVYEINRNFRNEGLSTQHNPEFTMLELYLAYADYRDLMEWVEKALRGLADAVHGTRQIEYQGRVYDLAAPFRRVSVEQALIELQSRHRSHVAARCDLPAQVLRRAAAFPSATATAPASCRSRSSRRRSSTRCSIRPSSMPIRRKSRRCRAPNDADPFITDRFEFFLAGRELANGFSELNDPEDQAARFQAQVARKDKAMRRRCSTTPTTCARSSTACRRRRDSASASTGW